MNKKLFIWILVLIALSSFVSAELNDSVAYYSFDTGNYSGNNVYDLSEGVVCKGITKTKRKKIEQIHMSKIKTIEWLQKVKKKYGQDKLLEELNGDKSLMI